MDLKFIPEPTTTTIYHATKITSKEKLIIGKSFTSLIFLGVLLGTAFTCLYILLKF